MCWINSIIKKLCVSCWTAYILQDDTRSLQYQVKNVLLSSILVPLLKPLVIQLHPCHKEERRGEKRRLSTHKPSVRDKIRHIVASAVLLRSKFKIKKKHSPSSPLSLSLSLSLYSPLRATTFKSEDWSSVIKFLTSKRNKWRSWRNTSNLKYHRYVSGIFTPSLNKQSVFSDDVLSPGIY